VDCSTCSRFNACEALEWCKNNRTRLKLAMFWQTAMGEALEVMRVFLGQMTGIRSANGHLSKVVFAFFIFLLGVLFKAHLFDLKKENDSKALKVVYPIRAFSNRDGILSPENTETVWEYYLLENLAVGLIRDSLSDPRGYEPALAQDWQQVSVSAWIFQIRENLKWSNGEPITLLTVRDHLLKLSKSPTRHGFALRHLERIEVDQQNHSLQLEFSRPTNRSVLHELSLADAALVYPEDTRFEVTSGPFYVEEDARAQSRIKLRANPHSALKRENSPQRVELFGLREGEKPAEIFRSIETDIFFAHIYPFLSLFAEIEKNEPNVVFSQPTSAYFFEFNWDHPLSKNSSIRKEFASFIAHALQRIENANLQVDYQFLPIGFSGRLKDYEPEGFIPNHLKHEKVKVRIDPQLRQIMRFEEALQEAVDEFSLKANFIFDLGANVKETLFADFKIFKGNQKDPIGSWAFLSLHEDAPLSPFKDRISRVIADAMSTQDEDEKSDLLESLHRKTLEEAWVVPFGFAKYRTFHSDRVTLRNWNPFDLRHRFYDVEWE
jgi:ABC-type transport system substrate-binding protein